MSVGKLFAQFDSRIRLLDASRVRVDQLVSAGTISARVAEQMYESLFLNAFTSFELYIEELFLDLLVRSHGRYGRRAIPRLTIRSYAIARELVTGPGRNYADWLPYKKTMERAEVFFRGGRPFTSVSILDRQTLDKALLVRNVIAHRSRYSLSKFEREVIGSAPLPARERTPAGYLRGLVSAAPPQTRFENFVAHMLRIARQLA